MSILDTSESMIASSDEYLRHNRNLFESEKDAEQKRIGIKKAAALSRAEELGAGRDAVVPVPRVYASAQNSTPQKKDAIVPTPVSVATSPVSKQPFPVALLPRPRQNHNITITAVVFYGRRSRVRTLNCYLERNLVSNGGLLSEVVFVVATWDQKDMAYLAKLIASHPGVYRKQVPERWDIGYTGHYAWLKPDQYYVKIDDDVTYFKDDALDIMLNAYLEHKYFLISANVINHQPLEWPHGQSGAEYNFTSKTVNGVTQWSMEPNVQFKDDGWAVWHHWERAVNVHYSFLHNYRHNQLHKYNFPNNETYFDFNKHFGYTRWRINMIIFRGADFDVHKYNMSSTTGTYPGDDEDFITRILPQQLKVHSAAVSGALAVHFSFYPQRGGLENNTDLLQQYANLANEHCGRLIDWDDKDDTAWVTRERGPAKKKPETPKPTGTGAAYLKATPAKPTFNPNAPKYVLVSDGGNAMKWVKMVNGSVVSEQKPSTTNTTQQTQKQLPAPQQKQPPQSQPQKQQQPGQPQESFEQQQARLRKQAAAGMQLLQNPGAVPKPHIVGLAEMRQHIGQAALLRTQPQGKRVLRHRL